LNDVQAPALESSTAAESRRDAALSLGARLRSARKARALTLEQVSQRLHLEESMLRAIEDDRYAALGAPVFVRGYLKAYAGLLGLPEQSVLDAYRQADPASTQPPKLVRDRDELPMVAPRLPGALAMAGAGVLLLVLFLVFRPAEEGGAPPPESAPPQAGNQAEVPVPPAGPVQTLEPASPASPAPPVPEASTAAAGKLVLEFEEASWVEISDRSGRLLFGEQPAGSRQVLSGQPPFSVALGNAPGVRLSVDGQPWPVPDDARSAGSKVARFRIESLSR
jgi:cytoskeleton protein RodZ